MLIKNTGPSKFVQTLHDLRKRKRLCQKKRKKKRGKRSNIITAYHLFLQMPYNLVIDQMM